MVNEAARRRPRGIVPLLKDVLSSGTWDEHHDDIETLHKFILDNAICIVGVVFFGGFGVLDTVRGIQPLGAIVTAAGVIVGANFVYLRLTRNLRVSSYVNVSVITFAFICLLSSGGSGNTGPLWCYSLPVALLFLLGLRAGSLLSLAFLAAAIVILFVPGFPLLTTTYPLEFKIRFIPTMLGVTICSYVLEYTRSVTQGRLVENNRTLAGTVAEVRRAESALGDEKERLDVTLRSIRDGVITTDPGGVITLVSREAEELTGWHRGAALGRRVAAARRPRPRHRGASGLPRRDGAPAAGGRAAPGPEARGRRRARGRDRPRLQQPPHGDPRQRPARRDLPPEGEGRLAAPRRHRGGGGEGDGPHAAAAHLLQGQGAGEEHPRPRAAARRGGRRADRAGGEQPRHQREGGHGRRWGPRRAHRPPGARGGARRGRRRTGRSGSASPTGGRG